MVFFRRKKLDIRIPTGKDAVNWRKLLFLSIAESFNLLTTEQWSRLDVRCLTLMKVKMLRASCIARELEPRGKKRILVQRLTESLEKQRADEAASRREAELAEQRRQDKLGGIWTFGTGTQGQLGHNDCQSYALPTQIKTTRGLGVCQVYAGFDSDITFAVTRLGDVYVWGNKNGPTGLPRQKRRNRFDSAGAPKLNLFNLPSYKPHDASADNPTDAKGTPPERDAMDSSDESNDDDDDDDDGDAVSEDSHHADDDEAPTDDQLAMIIPAPVKLKSISGEDIVQIAVGRVHCAARTKCGDVFTWGQNDHCQLGNEPQHALSAAQSKRAKIKYGVDAMEPTIWSRTVSEKCIVKGVAVGTDHTMIISDDGDIHAFGSVYNTTDHSTLTRHLRKQRVQQVSCGAMHAAIVNDGGLMYTWGSGDGGRLGHGDLISHVAPRLVEALATDVVFQISCGCWHTVAIVLVPPLLKGGFVYSWGTGRYGQLALGGNQVVPTPTLIQDFLTQCVYIKRVCAGMYHNAALSVDDEVYTWGSNVNGCLGRPTEMASNPESFSAVPGMVEGMAEFVGRPCSIAVGREYTVVATKPYIGPTEDEVATARAEAAKRQAAIDKAYDAEERKEEIREAMIERLQRSRCIEYLNLHHPQCSQCSIATVCPGFQRDEIDPQLCKHCLHVKQNHNAQHRESNKALSLDALLGLLHQMQIADDVDLAIPEDELVQDKSAEARWRK
ncbi:hypothetical protein, variant [Aphanomyces invadans]|uniref:RCC1-like domain-containing protein n=1 Tax=Aphanomyces invadans TaxID=157072 RepID=A0A024U206_9STRA|nr:hypothetical protein, variant [Aphanomyces invadans]ETW00260.1 hypothetical protein, variant [Aphanomyces invadans]|eukprot:XP_008871285.1 hypothetical protein, variant [Aphanomyces invadans]